MDDREQRGYVPSYMPKRPASDNYLPQIPISSVPHSYNTPSYPIDPTPSPYTPSTIHSNDSSPHSHPPSGSGYLDSWPEVINIPMDPALAMDFYAPVDGHVRRPHEAEDPHLESARTKTRARRAQSAETQDQGTGRTRKQRGRPRLDTKDENAADRRRTQIRLAQRAYRLRKETTISSLRTRVAELEGAIEGLQSVFLELHDSVLQRKDALDEREIYSLAERFSALARGALGGSEAAESTGAEESERHHENINNCDDDGSRRRSKDDSTGGTHSTSSTGSSWGYQSNSQVPSQAAPSNYSSNTSSRSYDPQSYSVYNEFSYVPQDDSFSSRLRRATLENSAGLRRANGNSREYLRPEEVENFLIESGVLSRASSPTDSPHELSENGSPTSYSHDDIAFSRSPTMERYTSVDSGIDNAEVFARPKSDLYARVIQGVRKTVNLEVLIKELTRRGVINGSHPGFTRTDVDYAVHAASTPMVMVH